MVQVKLGKQGDVEGHLILKVKMSNDLDAVTQRAGHESRNPDSQGSA